jgi:hypothetical protein
VDRRRTLTLLASLLAVLLLAINAGCGSGSGSSSSSGGGTSGGGKPGSDIKVGLVADIGGLNDHGFNELAANAIKQAHDDLGVQIKLLESKSDADYIPNRPRRRGRPDAASGLGGPALRPQLDRQSRRSIASTDCSSRSSRMSISSSVMISGGARSTASIIRFSTGAGEL